MRITITIEPDRASEPLPQWYLDMEKERLRRRMEREMSVPAPPEVMEIISKNFWELFDTPKQTDAPCTSCGKPRSVLRKSLTDHLCNACRAQESE